MKWRERPLRAERSAPPQQTTRSADAALTPRALQHLQRTIGNHAVGRLLRRTSSGTARLQRVGGEKIGFNLTPSIDPAVQAGQQLLVDEWKQVRQTEHALKVGAEQTEVEAGAKEFIGFRAREKARDEYRAAHKGATRGDLKTAGLEVKPTPITAGKGFSKYYYGKLTGRGRTEQLTLLKTRDAFRDARLVIDDTTGDIKYRPHDMQPYVSIGTLMKGVAAFSVKSPATSTSATKRDVLEKQGVSTDLSNEAKEYVKDSLDVLTRRYAYVEKNYWQMMEFFMTSRHEGRFQTFMKAAGEPSPDLYEARQPEVDIVRGTSATPGLTKEQLAVAHQKLGSGPQQRGVSLTSTPKVGVTYVNTGENFRTDRGFRLKIDLALIPPHPTGPLLINHYSHGGVIDKPDRYDTTRERGSTSTYPYKESAVHARELYLEYLNPEWVVAIESHPAAGALGTTIGPATPLGTATSLFELGRSMFGGAPFQRGFDEGLGTGTNSTPGDKDHTDGFSHGTSFKSGWTAGNAAHASDSASDATEAGKASVTLPQYIYDKSMAVSLPTGEFDIYRLGYLHGRSGAALITTGANLPH